MRRGDADIARYVRERTGATTPAERGRQIETLTRYRRPLAEDRPTAYPRGFFTPPGFQAGDTTTSLTLGSGTTIYRYLGQAPDDLSLVTVRFNVTVGGSTITWAEVGIATALEFPFGSPDLILEGYTGVAGDVNSTGVKSIDVAVNIGYGAHVFALIGAVASTMPQLRGGLGDPLTTGYQGFLGSTQPSTMANPTTFNASSNASASPWLAVQW